ncbi:hypothetical protein SCHPADRAFT_745166 [Schizopora paradoxa]|uniref:Uncharacterized protein n=1 Tax=Schizopora paradoxa TaxID=27342 RepID=A0A0H2QZF9_9AGAM|nr:hypothetical protein SCHPADRAFT_745166 [Schizopora paradoxa]
MGRMSRWNVAFSLRTRCVLRAIGLPISPRYDLPLHPPPSTARMRNVPNAGKRERSALLFPCPFPASSNSRSSSRLHVDDGTYRRPASEVAGMVMPRDGRMGWRGDPCECSPFVVSARPTHHALTVLHPPFSCSPPTRRRDVSSESAVRRALCYPYTASSFAHSSFQAAHRRRDVSTSAEHGDEE